ncbi:23S rRNA (adenine(2030)-N(6))-methyltransferase RlmJ [Thermomonas sp.]|uniref:23S rRNA (adenine(2030)-N(6))-methyltransferase RlmJ n=1 Tax=Thermomonas sp. TaxID=1971895 RepID=UPI002610A244|nr:23S rRNA (adenine(2030)-N(6))-methyltransferase RlmJ [Thermomonas sp.]MCO5056200.1 23S rRNA (adenine(2030)-N(6))-methyltransferase RlmJ [Thermomonas sp.]
MNYRHAFHAGNHGDVLKHVVLLALCQALTVKPAPCFALDTHAGRGLYRLDDDTARKTGEAQGGIARLLALAAPPHALQPLLAAVRACRQQHGESAYPGSPWLLAHALRAQDRIALCELQDEEAQALRVALPHDPRIAIHVRDGYAAVKALLPPHDRGQALARGLVLIDPPYEAQLAEFGQALAALREGLTRWPQGAFALWYPIKLGRALQPFRRAAAQLPARAVLQVELRVRPDDSPLRMNGSGMLLLNPPWQLDRALAPALEALQAGLGEAGASASIDWLRSPA